MDIQSLRASIISQRKQLSIVQQIVASQRIVQRVQTLAIFQRAQKLACYVAVNGEVDCTALIKSCWQADKSCYLPVLHPLKQQRLCFARYQKNGRLQLNRFCIPEPAIQQNKLISPAQLDVVIVPLIAFDESGNRLGTGGGYYDRTFAFKHHSITKQKPILIGVAYEFQKVRELQPMSWDVPLQYVVTETTVYKDLLQHC